MSDHQDQIPVSPAFIHVASEMAQAIKFILQDAHTRLPNELCDVAKVWVDRLKMVEAYAAKTLPPSSAAGSTGEMPLRKGGGGDRSA